MDAVPPSPLLTDSKIEFLDQLTDALAPFVINYIIHMYNETHQGWSNGITKFRLALRNVLKTEPAAVFR